MTRLVRVDLNLAMEAAGILDFDRITLQRPRRTGCHAKTANFAARFIGTAAYWPTARIDKLDGNLTIDVGAGHDVQRFTWVDGG